MTTLKRRHVLVGICACCSPFGASHSIAWPSTHGGEVNQTVPAGGCYLNAREASDLGTTLYSANTFNAGTGDANLDSFLGRALARAASELKVNPAFGFYDEGGGPPNAMASSDVASHISGTWGTVLFGQQLFRREMGMFDTSGMTILAIISHEFAHIIQFKGGLYERLLQGQETVKRLELHADVIAGFYLGIRKRQTPDLSFTTAEEVFYRIGDTAFNDRNHHGTPEERAVASQLGFELASQGNANLDRVIQAGIDHVMVL